MEDFIQKRPELLCLFFSRFFILYGENIKMSMNLAIHVTLWSLCPTAQGALTFPPSIKKLLCPLSSAAEHIVMALICCKARILFHYQNFHWDYTDDQRSPA